MHHHRHPHLGGDVVDAGHLRGVKGEVEFHFTDADRAVGDSRSQRLVRIRFRGIEADGANEAVRALFHFQLCLVLIFGSRQQYGVGDAAALHVSEAIIGLAP